MVAVAVGLGANASCRESRQRRYNVRMALRLALDARKLTDFGIGTYIRALLRGLDVRPDLELSVLTRSGYEERVASIAPGARVLTTSARGYSLQMPSTIRRRRRVDMAPLANTILRGKKCAGRRGRGSAG